METRLRRFKPTLPGTLAVLASLPLLMSLGFWQLRRADEKRELIDQFAGGDVTTQQLHADSVAELPLLQHISVHGRFDGSRQVLLDNIPAAKDASGFGRPGYRVLTPMSIDEKHILLIDRGWIPLGRTRSELPNLAVNGEPRAVRGRIAELPRAGIRMKNEPANVPWPRVMNFPTLLELRELYGEALLPRIVLLDPNEPDGFKRDWSARYSVGEFGPDKHIGYAVQWFGLALALVVIYIVVGIHRGKQESI
jgi:surfeit locus 1 family protein